MEPFLFETLNGIPVFRLLVWEQRYPHVIAGFSAREKEADKDGRNYALHVGENPEQVIENRRRLAEGLGMSLATWTCGEQVHRTHIQEVTSIDRGKGNTSRKEAFPETDGMFTKEADLLLASFYADCVPLFFYSPDLDLVGIAHAGWKGTVGKIGPRMVQEMVQRGADPKQIEVVIGPSISSCCYEVDQRVIEPLREAYQAELPEEIAKPTDESHWKLDLKQANRALLRHAGVSDSHIFISSYCTSCEDSFFYSHRRDQGDTGRMVAYIGKRG